MAIVYFGTFDPFHENHFRLVEYVVKKYHPKRLVIVPNNDNPHKGSGFKSEALPIDKRIEIIEARFQNLDGANRLLSRVVEVCHPGEYQTNWYGRKMLGFKIGKEHHLPILYIILGTDSLESTFNRISQGVNPLERFPFKILTIPRKGYRIPTLPEELRERILIDVDYNEQYTVSSTLIRQLIRQKLPVDPYLCHSSVVKYIEDQKLYKAFDESFFDRYPKEQPFKFTEVVVLMGSPGSGKSTIGEELAKKLEYGFYSTGEVYREHRDKRSPEYLEVERHHNDPLDYRQALGVFILDYLYKEFKSLPVNKLGGIVIEGFKAGDLTHFTNYISKVDRLYVVYVDLLLLKDRVKTRNLDRVDSVAFQNRVDRYFQLYQPEIQAEVKSLVKAKQIGRVVTLDNSGTIEETIKKILH